MRTRIENDNITVISSEEGMDLFDNFLERNVGKECWLGYVYYDKNSNLLESPYLLEPKDFSEIPEEISDASVNNSDSSENTED